MTATTAARRGGGANKRRRGGRVDQDGDLVMGENRISKSRARNSQRESTPTSRSAPPTGPRRGLFNNSNFQRELARHVNSKPAAPRTARPQTRSRNTSLIDIRISGWKSSKASTNDDGGIAALVAFLEKRATILMGKVSTTEKGPTKPPVKIRKYRIEGDDLVISVPPAEKDIMLRLNGYQFAGVNIKVAEAASLPAPESSESSNEMRRLFHSFLSRRYNADLKLLDLNSLGQDQELNSVGMFTSASTQSKFFPALMKICDELFKSAQEKRETVESVTLAQNELSTLSAVTTLAQTFPDVKNLDLSKNKFPDLKTLEPWRRKFRHLDHLILSENPLEQSTPGYNLEIMKWYPSLRILNGVQVRTDAEVAMASKSGGLPIPVSPPIFHDEAQIGENFLKTFFPGFDTGRNDLLQMYYDSDTMFSLCVNTKAPRDPNSQQTLGKQEWGQYIKQSRNHKHITTLPARVDRLYRGIDSIREIWKNLPATRHPNLTADPQKWLLECQSIPSIPDQTGQSATGVGGLLLTAHGEYEELDPSGAIKLRSFDRTFVLGPGGATGVRVVRELWTIRAYGGFSAFQPDQPTVANTITDNAACTAQPAQHEQLMAELSRLTGMRADYSKMCLEESAWALDRALEAFQNAKANLPPDAFV